MLKIKFFLVLLLLPLPALAETTIKITEVAWMGSVTSSNDEWLELYNPNDEDINLTGWSLVADDGSPEIELEGIILKNNFLLLERTDDETVPTITADQLYSGALSNTGEWLKLYNQNGQLVDEIKAIDGWPAGDNTTKQTMELVGTTWQNSLQPNGSPRATNTATTTEDIVIEDTNSTNDQMPSTEELPEQKVAKQDIVINEIFPNPTGPDTTDEFIELKNISNVPIDLTGWQLATQAQSYTLPSLKIWPNITVAFYRPESKLALGNEKEKISLYTKNNQLIDRVEYKSSAKENLSYQRTASLELVWAQPSSQQENNAEKEIPPVIVLTPPKEGVINEFILFDASDSFDPQNRELKFFWNFGDGRNSEGYLTRQIYTQPGIYQATLKIVADSHASSTKDFKIKIVDPRPIQVTTSPTSTKPLIPETAPEETPFIFISEFLPNPAGSDDQEFIELFSGHSKPFDLGGWQLDDDVNGSRPYTIPEHTIINPGQYRSFFKTQTKIALNNDHDAVQLLTPAGLLVSYAEYDQPTENASLVLDEQSGWQETTTPTPDEINVLDIIKAPSTTPSTTPQILGSNTEEIPSSTNPTRRYLFSLFSAVGVIAAALFMIFSKTK